MIRDQRVLELANDLCEGNRDLSPTAAVAYAIRMADAEDREEYGEMLRPIREAGGDDEDEGWVWGGHDPEDIREERADAEYHRRRDEGEVEWSCW